MEKQGRSKGIIMGGESKFADLTFIVGDVAGEDGYRERQRQGIWVTSSRFFYKFNTVRCDFLASNIQKVHGETDVLKMCIW